MTENSNTKIRLLDAAQNLIQKVGANGMSYQDLSNEVGIRKASIHYHFPTKSDLLSALLDRYTLDFLNKVDLLLKEELSGSETLKAYCTLFEQTLQVDPNMASPSIMLGAELASLDSTTHSKLKNFYQINTDRLISILENGKKDQTLNFIGSPDSLAWLLFSMLEGSMLIVRVDGGIIKFQQIIQQFFHLVGLQTK